MNNLARTNAHSARHPRPAFAQRQAMQWVMDRRNGFGAANATSHGQPAPNRKDFAASQPGTAGVGYGLDAKLVAVLQPGDLWPLTFDDHHRKTASLLADVILPEDQYGPLGHYCRRRADDR